MCRWLRDITCGRRDVSRCRSASVCGDAEISVTLGVPVVLLTGVTIYYIFVDVFVGSRETRRHVICAVGRYHKDSTSPLTTYTSHEGRRYTHSHKSQRTMRTVPSPPPPQHSPLSSCLHAFGILSPHFQFICCLTFGPCSSLSPLMIAIRPLLCSHARNSHALYHPLCGVSTLACPNTKEWSLS